MELLWRAACEESLDLLSEDFDPGWNVEGVEGRRMAGEQELVELVAAQALQAGHLIHPEKARDSESV